MYKHSLKKCIHNEKLGWLILFVAVDCGVPDPPINGAVESFSSVMFGANVTYECDEGYSLSISHSTCAKSKKWEPVPICEKPAGEQFQCIYGN